MDDDAISQLVDWQLEKKFTPANWNCGNCRALWHGLPYGDCPGSHVKVDKSPDTPYRVFDDRGITF